MSLDPHVLSNAAESASSINAKKAKKGDVLPKWKKKKLRTKAQRCQSVVDKLKYLLKKAQNLSMEAEKERGTSKGIKNFPGSKDKGQNGAEKKRKKSKKGRAEKTQANGVREKEEEGKKEALKKIVEGNQKKQSKLKRRKKWEKSKNHTKKQNQEQGMEEERSRRRMETRDVGVPEQMNSGKKVKEEEMKGNVCQRGVETRDVGVPEKQKKKKRKMKKELEEGIQEKVVEGTRDDVGSSDSEQVKEEETEANIRRRAGETRDIGVPERHHGWRKIKKEHKEEGMEKRMSEAGVGTRDMGVPEKEEKENHSKVKKERMEADISEGGVGTRDVGFPQNGEKKKRAKKKRSLEVGMEINANEGKEEKRRRKKRKKQEALLEKGAVEMITDEAGGWDEDASQEEVKRKKKKEKAQKAKVKKGKTERLVAKESKGKDGSLDKVKKKKKFQENFTDVSMETMDLELKEVVETKKRKKTEKEDGETIKIKKKRKKTTDVSTEREEGEAEGQKERKKKKKKRIYRVEEEHSVESTGEEMKKTSEKSTSTPAGEEMKNGEMCEKEALKKQKKKGVRTEHGEGKESEACVSDVRRKKQKRKNKDEGNISRKCISSMEEKDVSDILALKPNVKEESETEERDWTGPSDVVFLSVKPGNQDEISIDQERRLALQRDIDEESKPKLNFGQWDNAHLGSSERQMKFLRLMGGFKKSSQPIRPGGGRVNTALGKEGQQTLQHGLLAQFESAQNRHMDFQNKGVGLGFTAPSNKKFTIDVNARNSVRFDE